MPPVKTAVPPQAAPIYDAYRGWLAGRGVGNKTFESGARCFLARFPGPQAWAAQPLAARLAGTRPHLQPLLNFLMLHRHLRPGYDYLLERKLTVILREAAASPLGPDLKRFLAGAEALGYSVRARTGMASEVAIRVLIQTGRGLAELTDADFTGFGQAITEREARLGRAGAQAVHAGPVELGTPPGRGQPAGAQADGGLPGTAAGHARPLVGARHRVRAGALRPVPRPARPGPVLAGAAGPATSHRALPDRGRRGGQPPHRPADRRLHRQAAHPVCGQLPGRHRRVGLARDPGPAAGLPAGCAQAAAPAAPLPAPGLRTGAAGGAGGLAEPAARRCAVAAAGHRDAHRRADRPRAGLRA